MRSEALSGPAALPTKDGRSTSDEVSVLVDDRARCVVMAKGDGRVLGFALDADREEASTDLEVLVGRSALLLREAAGVGVGRWAAGVLDGAGGGVP